MDDHRIEIIEVRGAWHWSLKIGGAMPRQINGHFTGFLTRKEAEADATRAAEAMQIAAKSWLAEHPKDTDK